MRAIEVEESHYKSDLQFLNIDILKLIRLFIEVSTIYVINVKNN